MVAFNNADFSDCWSQRAISSNRGASEHETFISCQCLSKSIVSSSFDVLDTFICLLSSISYLSPSFLDHPPLFSSLLPWRLAES